MPLVSCKCTNCGANLQVDNTKDAAVCEFCGSAFIVEKAINNYNVTNNISAGVVNVFGGNSADFVIRAGSLEKYNGAATEVVIPNSVTRIGASAFYGCDGLTSVYIPNSVTSIGEQAFARCTGLTSIAVPDSVTSIGSHAFQGCTSLTSIVIPDSVTSIGSHAFQSCTSLTSIVIPDSITSIGIHAFQSCTSLTSIVIPDSVTSIGEWAFEGCTGLTSIVIPDSITSIGERAFARCTGLTSIAIPDSVTSIGYWVFEGCRYLKNVICTVELAEKFGNRFPPGSYARAEATKQTTSGCYIATSIYGSYDCPPVWTLRRYRDDTLAATWYGRAFIRTYYAVSPTLVKWFGRTAWFQRLWRDRLDRLVVRLNGQGVEDTPYQDQSW